LPKINYKHEKRQKDIQKKKKHDEKLRRRQQEKKVVPVQAEIPAQASVEKPAVVSETDKQE
jgi:hypothetical protein